MASNKKNLIQKGIETQRVFKYSVLKPAVSLSFTLSVENSSELRGFLTLLKEATKDVEQAIAEVNN